MFAGYEMGGQLMTTTDVENYPGFPKGIQGPEMMELFKQQAERFGTHIVPTDVTAVDFKTRPLRVVAGKEEYTADGVIVSTGAKAKMLGMKGEKEFWGKGISTCATCDGAFFRDRVVAVVGGGDTAAEEALFMTRLASQVYLVHRREEFRASKIMVERMKQNPKISFLLNRVVEEVKGGKVLEAMVLHNTQDNAKPQEVPVSGLFEAIGHEPNTQLFEGQLDMHPNRYLKVKPGTTETNIPGVFAAGDVTDHVYRQAVTAAGMGCMAAIALERWLKT
jgi:thioredoxin reductase (NADPH)